VSLRPPVYILLFCAGAAALSWELLWQHFAALALGVSAGGTAIVLATTMAGMTIGSLACGSLLAGRAVEKPLWLYVACEAVIGIAGLALEPGFRALERLDVAIYHAAAGAAPLAHALGVALLLSPATLAMGATLPVLGLIADRHQLSLAGLYGTNIAGASVGVLALAFAVIPAVGIHITAGLASSVNLAVAAVSGALAMRAHGHDRRAHASAPAAEPPFPFPAACAVALTTGLATFALEVAWFRSLRATFHSGTDAFAVLLFAVLLPLALGAHAAPWLRRRRVALPWVLAAAGILVLAATTPIDRLDQLVPLPPYYWPRMALWTLLSLALIGPPVALLGASLPWLLEVFAGPRHQGRLYGINAVGAVLGSLGAAWGLLPLVGAATSARLAGAALVVAGAALLRGRSRALAAAALVVAFGASALSDSGVGTTRARWWGDRSGYRVLAHEEGPDVSTSVLERRADKARVLLIDGFPASVENLRGAHYMTWMGRLPMLLAADPRRALVICFGTGQTAQGVLDEGPARLDLVDVNKAVFTHADLFESNHGVLKDPRATALVMDGRAWLRRTDAVYDVVTLEPMPPTFAGVNALYSREFYAIASARMREGGVLAQWLPFHLLSPADAFHIAAAFVAVFPDSILWVDPVSTTGILLGRKGPGSPPLGERWPGFLRRQVARDLDEPQVRAAVKLMPPALARYASLGTPVTDNNQVLAYGSASALVPLDRSAELQKTQEWFVELAASGRALR
jgi:spermidine synthase